MKNYKWFLCMMLISVVAFFSSCSDNDDVFYYSFKNIEYSVEVGDGMTEYETDWLERFVLVNNGNTEVTAGPGDMYLGFHERYCFECGDPSLFNPTVGHVHVPLPKSFSGNQIVFDEKEGEYSMLETDVFRIYESKMYDVPANTKLTIEGKLEMKKLVLTYTATFQRHPKGQDHVVTGKFVRHIPMSISLVEKYEPVTE